MKLRNNILIIMFLSTIISISIVNTKNNNKVNIYFFNYKSQKISLGNLITISFLTGFTLTSFYNNIISFDKRNSKYNSKENEDNKINSEFENDLKVEEKLSERDEMRPPSRDIRETQPTISVNYRVIGQNEKKNKDKSYNLNNERNENIQDDWETYDSDW
tara:strand:+ start:1495 stop:1974 length:480 start_codon:yes stop_codon:yes gene_type:complete